MKYSFIVATTQIRLRTTCGMSWVQPKVELRLISRERQSKWQQDASTFQLEIIRSTSRSIGDAMRDLDARSILSGDFFVVYGDIVSNLPMDPVLREHRARRSIDKNAIMTMVLREAGILHPNKAFDASPVFVIDPAKNRCLHYEQLIPHSDRHYVEVDAEMMSKDLDIRNDLIDCGIDICTPEVLALWSDNFDYENPRRGFLHSVLKDYELNGKTIHTHVVNRDYAARVRDLNAYDSISKDVMSRWTFPMCLDTSLHTSHFVQMCRNNVLIGEGCRVPRSSIVGPNATIGNNTHVGDRSEIQGSTVGRDCHIGNGCAIINSYIWNGVTVGNETSVRNSIIASGVAIGDECRLSGGALVSYGVDLPNETSLVSGERVCRKRKRGEDQPSKLQEGNFEIIRDGSDGTEPIGPFGHSSKLQTREKMSSPANEQQCTLCKVYLSLKNQYRPFTLKNHLARRAWNTAVVLCRTTQKIARDHEPVKSL